MTPKKTPNSPKPTPRKAAPKVKAPKPRIAWAQFDKATGEMFGDYVYSQRLSPRHEECVIRRVTIAPAKPRAKRKVVKP